jgi:peroxiredoxin
VTPLDTAVAIGSRVVLAVVFGVAAILKLRDLGNTARAVEQVGVPRQLSGVAAWMLPGIELVVALGMLSEPASRVAAWGALGLLVLFTAVVLANLLKGKRPNCHCFGQLTNRPMGWPTVGRNLVLIGLAAFVIAPAPHLVGLTVLNLLATLSLVEFIALFNGFIALTFAVMSLWLQSQLVSQSGRVLTRLEALEGSTYPVPRMLAKLRTGSEAPPFELSRIDGTNVSLASLLERRLPVLLIFVDAACHACVELAPQIDQWRRDLHAVLTIAVLTRESRRDLVSAGAESVSTALVDLGGVVAARYGVVGTPSAIIIEADATVGTLLAQGESAIQAIVEARGVVERV